MCFNLKFSSIYPCEIRATISQRGCERTCKLFAVDRFTARAITVGKVAALEHEIGNDTVERGSGVTKPVLARGELAEVPGCLGHDLVEKPEHDAAGLLAVDCDFELGWISVRSAGLEEERNVRIRRTWWIE